MIDPLPSDIFRPGQILNNTYEITGVLGRGGTGEVYCARNLITGRVVAIKALSAQFSANADYIELMKREEEMRAISHDSVVRYSECSRTDAGHVFLVMDFIDGPSVSEVMHARRLDPKELLIIAHRVAEGLVATHARGIVHRDLSPDNVILRGGDPAAAVIIDFGIAKDTAAGARTIVADGSFAGKYEYAAPEQVDGRSDARTDLYALGALILAAWRGEVPFRGATPGEIVRRKQSPLETEGVPEPLKHVVDALAAPDPNDRPTSAAEAVALIEAALRPQSSTRRAAAPRRRRLWPWLVLPAGVAAAAALWFGTAGLFGPPTLPRADPWTFSAGWGKTGAYLVGHAPDEEGAAALLAAYREAAGAEPERLGLTLAAGMPSPDWSGHVADLLDLLGTAERWELSLSGMGGTLAGLAPEVAARDRLGTEVGAWEAATGIDLDAQIAAGPERLPAAEVQRMLSPLASCGPLRQAADADAIYALGDTIAVKGPVAGPEDAQRIRQALLPEVGDRAIATDLQVLNDELCTIRALFPLSRAAAEERSEVLSISLSDGVTGAPNLTGVFNVLDSPVVDILVPPGLDGYLWVIAVDNEGVAWHILPTRNRPEHRLSELGEIVAGIRRIRALYSPAEHEADTANPVLGFEGELGKSEIIAIVTPTPLFDELRPSNGESVQSLAEALGPALQEHGGDGMLIDTQLIEARQ